MRAHHDPRRNRTANRSNDQDRDPRRRRRSHAAPNSARRGAQRAAKASPTSKPTGTPTTRAKRRGAVTAGQARRTERRTHTKNTGRNPNTSTVKSRLKQRVIVNSAALESEPRFSIGQSRPRLWLLIGSFAVILAVILGQVIQLQTSDGERYRVEAADQSLRRRALPADRGSIFDRNGEELAVSVPAVTISINPMLIEDPLFIAEVLERIVGIDAETKQQLYDEMVAKQSGFVYVARQVDPAIGDQLRGLGLEGINIDDKDKRVLPGGNTGLSVIGRTDIDGNGISGLEYQYGGTERAAQDGYTNILTGTPGEVSREVGAGGQSVAGTEQIIAEPIAGEDLVLTLDRSIQFATEQALLTQVTDLDAQSGTAIVMDTDTGDVYAMASVINDEEDGIEITSGNLAAVNAYEPGSVAKVITTAAALNEGAVTAGTTFVVPWTREYYGEWLSDSHQHPDTAWTVEEILVVSSNIGTIDVQQSIGSETHYKYMRAFGLGEKTGLDFPRESAGILKDYEDLWANETVTIAYGQGVSSTSIQLASAINVVANDGTYVAPRLVTGFVDPTGQLVEAEPSATHQVVTPEVAEEVQRMMRRVVCEGTGKVAQEGIENFSVAGKTGTGLKPWPNGQYEDELGRRRYYASFVGFFPAQDPQVTVLVSIDEPDRNLTSQDGTALRYGGTAAAPVFSEIAPTIVHELGIEPPTDSGACPE